MNASGGLAGFTLMSPRGYGDSGIGLCRSVFGLLSEFMLIYESWKTFIAINSLREDMMNRVQFLSTFPPEAKISGRPSGLDAEWNVTVSSMVPRDASEKPIAAIIKIDVDLVWKGRSGQRKPTLETVKPATIAYENYDLQEAPRKNFSALTASR